MLLEYNNHNIPTSDGDPTGHFGGHRRGLALRAGPWAGDGCRRGARSAELLRVCAPGGSIGYGKHTKNYGKSPFFMGKSTISMVIFNSYVTNYQRD